MNSVYYPHKLPSKTPLLSSDVKQLISMEIMENHKQKCIVNSFLTPANQPNKQTKILHPPPKPSNVTQGKLSKNEGGSRDSSKVYQNTLHDATGWSGPHR
jgi:hypothetical protein